MVVLLDVSVTGLDTPVFVFIHGRYWQLLRFVWLSLITCIHCVLELLTQWRVIFFSLTETLMTDWSPTEEHGSFISSATPGSLSVVQETSLPRKLRILRTNVKSPLKMLECDRACATPPLPPPTSYRAGRVVQKRVLSMECLLQSLPTSTRSGRDQTNAPKPCIGGWDLKFKKCCLYQHETYSLINLLESR